MEVTLFLEKVEKIGRELTRFQNNRSIGNPDLAHAIANLEAGFEFEFYFESPLALEKNSKINLKTLAKSKWERVLNKYFPDWVHSIQDDMEKSGTKQTKIEYLFDNFSSLKKVVDHFDLFDILPALKDGDSSQEDPESV